ncbi:MAG: T9SS type A sorting domain-containing protein [Bacteroidota bacterium]
MPERRSRSSLSQSTAVKLGKQLVRSAVVVGLLVAGIFFVTQNTESETLVDTDGDGIPNMYDLDDDNDGIPDSKECEGTPNSQFSIINGGFESPVISKNYSIMNENSVDGWHSTSSHNVIEIWRSGFLGIDAYEGNQLAELNARDAAATYQIISTVPGDVLYWSFAHRGRASATVADVMQIEIGPEGGTYNYSETMSDNNTAWGFYSGTYTVPAGQTQTRFALTAVSTATGNISVGNMVDDFILYSTQNCLADFDQDGIPNSEDLDSDNDGIMDIVEAGGTDINGDGMVDYPIQGDPSSMIDDDGDGLIDALDNQDSGSGEREVTDGTPLSLFNTDHEGEEDYLDIDSDDDGIVDNTEAMASDAYIAPSGVDTDQDGVDDSYDGDCTPCGSITGMVITPINSGGNPIADYRDEDSDGDGIFDRIEGHDTNSDGVINGSDSPFANTGKSGGSGDSDEDGLLDGFDNDLINYDPTNGGASASSYADNDANTAELSWRESINFPVEWLDFDVKMLGSHAEVSWSTAIEVNNDYFEVQRSEKGGEFEEIGNVKGVGFSDQPTEYAFTDKTLGFLSSDQLYYRIKQIDIDGQSSFSSIVELAVVRSSEMDMNVYPNPTKGPIRIDWNTMETSNGISIDLFTINGQVVKSIKSASVQSAVDWDISHLPSGMYILKMRSGKAEMSKKVILE